MTGHVDDDVHYLFDAVLTELKNLFAVTQSWTYLSPLKRHSSAR